MKDTKVILFVLVSMFVAIIEMTIDPAFYVGRIFLGLSAFSLFTFAIAFVKENWQITNTNPKH